MAARRSKIARLPWELRNRVCEMLADGRAAREVCDLVNASDALSSQGLAPLTEQNVSEWRAGGQKDWEKDRAASDRLARLSEASLHLVAAAGGDPATVGSRLLAGRLTEMLDRAADEDALPLAKALAALRGAETAAEKVKLEKERFRRDAAEIVLKVLEDRRAAGIAEGSGTREEKTRAILALMDEVEK